MKVFVVDDEKPARERLKYVLEQMPEVSFCGEAENGRDALKLIQSAEPDIVLMDIRLPEISGLEAARHLARLETPPALIFTTAYEQYAVEAFDTKAVAYLLKPVRSEHLQKALNNAQALNRVQLASMMDRAEDVEGKPARSHLCIRLGNRLELISVSDVFYFQAEQKYVTVRHGGGEAVIEEPLKALEEEFSGYFLRIHRSALVSVAHVAGMQKTSLGRYQVSFKEIDDCLEVSRRLVASVRKAIRAL